MEKQGVLDLTENKSGNFSFRVQPSLKAIFVERCLNNPTGPVDPADLIRRFMAEYVQKTSQGKML